MQKLTADVKEQFSQNEKKWSPTLMKAGWTVLPSVILERQQALGLDATDINILLHLAKFWWYSENLPHPSKKTIADCMGVDKSTVRRHIAAMEKAGFITRKARYDKVQGQQSNFYTFDGLIKSAQPLAEEAIAARAKQQEESAKRRTRKRAITPLKKEED
jgi:predicted transcriptional regulator